jgi:hypoxanthine phosphoribosyltransferase
MCVLYFHGMEKEIKIDDKTFELFLSRKEILEKVEETVQWMNETYGEPENLPVVIPILNGALFYAMDVLRQVEGEYQWFPVKISSYTGMERGKEVEILSSDLGFLRGRDVLIIEDIVDTGHTMAAFVKELRSVLPRSIRMASLLIKPEALEMEVKPDYVGFEIGKEFIVGYGMDYNEKGRALEHIYQFRSTPS